MESRKKIKRFGEISRLRRLADSPARNFEKSPSRLSELSRKRLTESPNKDLNLTPPNEKEKDPTPPTDPTKNLIADKSSTFEPTDVNDLTSIVEIQHEIQPSISPIGELVSQHK